MKLGEKVVPISPYRILRFKNKIVTCALETIQEPCYFQCHLSFFGIGKYIPVKFILGPDKRFKFTHLEEGKDSTVMVTEVWEETGEYFLLKDTVEVKRSPITTDEYLRDLEEALATYVLPATDFCGVVVKIYSIPANLGFEPLVDGKAVEEVYTQINPPYSSTVSVIVDVKSHLITFPADVLTKYYG